ncbi:hypothetical protein BDA96_07G155900 [Sorghum bicolor]|uniref:Uncharacterized protein n=1 Tax=Sorghum bicolor TaxID=4558 RepID=A0A921QN88_SORBI|nr:hypothetical protein BDA96_07G155900 [Sorghum bicolor]
MFSVEFLGIWSVQDYLTDIENCGKTRSTAASLCPTQVQSRFSFDTNCKYSGNLHLIYWSIMISQDRKNSPYIQCSCNLCISMLLLMYY